MMDQIAFMVRYIPFWAIPLAFISVEFGFRYWLKGRKRVYRFCFFLTIFSFVMTCLYFWAGGPEKTARIILNFLFPR